MSERKGQDYHLDPNKLKEERERKGLSYSELAREARNIGKIVHITAKNIEEYECGDKRPNDFTIALLADALEVPRDSINK